jgi:hypothetical protein
MIRSRGLQHWLPVYLSQSLHRYRMRRIRRRQLTHVMFMICDHFEPRHAMVRPEQPAERMLAWEAGYRRFQDDMHARIGLRPLHTWFYPPHHGYEHLVSLARMCFQGLGEAELHYHHRDDTYESLHASLRQALVEFRRRGLLLQCGRPPGERFGFIHGDWALDNSADGKYCGVNDELSLLGDLGCWGDLTMPSANECQTRKINSIYYARGDKQRSKSHDWGSDARVGLPNQAGLMLVQGPLGFNFHAPGYPRVENSNLNDDNWGRPDRIGAWIDCHVHVAGRPEWLFVKLHTHGAVERDFDALFGEKAVKLHLELARQLNDGKKMRLHYVTARQGFNVIRAAEHGAGGDPTEYFDFELAPQVTSKYQIDAAHRTVACVDDELVIEGIEGTPETRLVLRYPPVVSVEGALRKFSLNGKESCLELHLRDPDGAARVVFAGRVLPTGLGSTRVTNVEIGVESVAFSAVGDSPLRLKY